MKKTGSLAAFALFAALSVSGARAEEAVFTARVDRDRIGQDESVSLRLVMESDGSARFSEPAYAAPDFELVNQYQDTQIRSLYEGGKFQVKNTQTITLVLRPLKAGSLKISQIRVNAGGKPLTAPDLSVEVAPPGAGTPPPRGYGGSGTGLRGSAKRPAGRPVVVRAEVSQDSAYKGEQLIVSYYIYRKAQVSQMAVDKYPDLKGFLREDIEMPILGQRLDWQQTMLDGSPYLRALLIRYAAYPVQEGKLRVDPMSLKYTYFMPPGGFSDDDDIVSNFFNQMAPRTGQERSDPITVTVLPLPREGRPDTFSGGVGDFNLAAAVNKYETRANEPVTLTLKVEGQGNVSAIGEPRAQWPENVELYDSKGVGKSGKGGVGSKVFEFVLIPRVPGKVAIPAIEMAFFDPKRKEYVTRSTEPFEITVIDAAPGNETARPPGGTPAPGIRPVEVETPRYLLPPSEDGASAGLLRGQPLWRWIYWLSAAALAFFVALVGRDLVKRARKRSSERSRRARSEAGKGWEGLSRRAQRARDGDWAEVSAAYEALAGAIFDHLDRRFSVGARSLSRGELRRILVEQKGVAPEKWERVSRVLEFSELVRFASGAGGISQAKAREELPKRIDEAQEGLSGL